MNDTIFREYDIRGKVGSEFNIAQTYDLARAIVTFLKAKNPTLTTIALGMDGRLSSPAIKEQIVAALCDSGITVIFIGLCPSPVLYFALHTLTVDAGLMITASHNPKEYNGIKILLGTTTVWGKQIKEIGAVYRSKQFLPLTLHKGTYHEKPLINSYVAWLREHFPSLIGMTLSVVIDSGNGTGGMVLPQLVQAMEWPNIKLLCVEVDGHYPNHEADPTVEKNMQDVKTALATTQVAIGIGLDGDSDRMAAMTKSGFLVPGDQLLAIFAQEILKQHPKSSVVFDIKASAGLIELLEQWGAKPIMSPCGHAIVEEYMHRNNAFIGGELSCHFFFKDRHFGFDDGIYAMMRLLEILVSKKTSLDELLKMFPKKWSSAEIRLECAEEKKQEIIDYLRHTFEKRENVPMITLDGIRVTFSYGWLNVRASNTQPVLSIRFEADSADNLTRIGYEIIELLSIYFDKALLQKIILKK